MIWVVSLEYEDATVAEAVEAAMVRWVVPALSVLPGVPTHRDGPQCPCRHGLGTVVMGFGSWPDCRWCP